MNERTFEKHMSKLQEHLNRICRELEPEVTNKDRVLWYNLAGDDRYRIHIPDISDLDEIFHFQIQPVADHMKSDETDVLVFVNRASEILSINVIGLNASNLERWQDFDLEHVNYEFLSEVISDIIVPLLEEQE